MAEKPAASGRYGNRTKNLSAHIFSDTNRTDTLFSKPLPLCDVFPPARSELLNLPKQCHRWEPSVQKSEPMGTSHPNHRMAS